MSSFNRIACIAAALASSSVLAQAPPSGQVPASGSDNAAFVEQATQQELTAIELSKVAQKNSTNPAVIKFARGIVRDDEEDARRLRDLATRKGMSVSQSLDPEHAALVRRLGSRNGSELDAEYAKDMASGGEKGIALYQTETSASDGDLAAYAQNSLPAMEQRQKISEQLADSTARRAT
jgi:putative membrane protein